ncbi:unknown [Clostridium sp. CAG:590]|nr:unknown [Clostridium sp. CAG:590]
MKKKNIFIWLLIFFVLLIGVTTTLILKNRDWFYETVPYYSETSDSGYRKEEDVIEEKYSTGVSRYREGNSVSRGGTLFCLRKGVSLDVNMNVTIKKGSFKVAIYELEKDFNIQGKSPDQYLSEDRKVHEEEYTETGTYQMDLSMLQPDETYMLVYMEPLGKDVAYSYNSVEQFYVKRWQNLYDSYIGSLPFFKTKYGGNVD